MRPEKKIFSLRWLMFAVFVTASISSVTLSRYMTTVSGTASASIARFQVELVSDPTAMTFDGSACNGNTEQRTYDFTVTSNSDVAVDYRVEVTFSTPPPNYVSLWIDEGVMQTGEEGKTQFIFSGYTYGLNDTDSKSHTLTIQADYGDGNQGKIQDDFKPGEVTVMVIAEQATTTQ